MAQNEKDTALNSKWDGRDSFTIDEAAEILSISRWMAYEAANNKELATIRFGRRFVVPRLALERLLTPA
jgi:excisionase family DNA binding protein